MVVPIPAALPTLPPVRALGSGRPTPEAFMSETISIRPWTDPVIDTLGHDPRAPYPERFWLPTLGPTALCLLRHVARRFDRAPGGFELNVAETSRCLGLGERDGRNSPLAPSLGRLVQFDLAAPEGEAILAVRRPGPPL